MARVAEEEGVGEEEDHDKDEPPHADRKRLEADKERV